MKAGLLDRRVVLERKTITGRNDYLEPIGAWVAVRQMWAQILPDAEGEETDSKAGRFAFARIKVRVRYFDDLEHTDRLVTEDGRTWQVLGWREIGRREGLEIAARWTG